MKHRKDIIIYLIVIVGMIILCYVPLIFITWNTTDFNSCTCTPNILSESALKQAKQDVQVIVQKISEYKLKTGEFPRQLSNIIDLSSIPSSPACDGLWIYYVYFDESGYRLGYGLCPYGVPGWYIDQNGEWSFDN